MVTEISMSQPGFVRILSTEYPPSPNGIATYVDQVAREMARMGSAVEVCLFCRDEVRQPQEPGLDVQHLSRGPFRLFRLFGMAAWILRRQRAHPADLVLAADYRCVVAAGLLPLRARKIALLHGTDVLGRLLLGLNRLRLYRPLAHFDRVVTNSEYTRSLVWAHHAYLPRHEVEVAPLGVDESKFAAAPQADLDRTCAALGLDPGRRLLICIGRIEPRKGQLYAVEAISALPEPLRDQVTSLIVGQVTDAEYAAQVDQAIAESRADIRRLGAIPGDQLHALFGLASALVHAAVPEPRAVEGFGLVLLEAAAQGLPAISTRADAIPEVVTPEGSGLLVPPRDVTALSAAIARLLTDGGLRERLSRAAIPHARAFTWQRHVERLLGLRESGEAPEPHVPTAEFD